MQGNKQTIPFSKNFMLQYSMCHIGNHVRVHTIIHCNIIHVTWKLKFNEIRTNNQIISYYKNHHLFWTIWANCGWMYVCNTSLLHEHELNLHEHIKEARCPSHSVYQQFKIMCFLLHRNLVIFALIVFVFKIFGVLNYRHPLQFSA